MAEFKNILDYFHHTGKNGEGKIDPMAVNHHSMDATMLIKCAKCGVYDMAFGETGHNMECEKCNMFYCRKCKVNYNGKCTLCPTCNKHH